MSDRPTTKRQAANPPSLLVQREDGEQASSPTPQASKRNRGRPAHTPEQKAAAKEQKQQRQRERQQDERTAASEERIQAEVDAAVAARRQAAASWSYQASGIRLGMLPWWAVPSDQPPSIVWTPACEDQFGCCARAVGGGYGCEACTARLPTAQHAAAGSWRPPAACTTPSECSVADVTVEDVCACTYAHIHMHMYLRSACCIQKRQPIIRLSAHSSQFRGGLNKAIPSLRDARMKTL
jgi:hypothetical protein